MPTIAASTKPSNRSSAAIAQVWPVPATTSIVTARNWSSSAQAHQYRCPEPLRGSPPLGGARGRRLLRGGWLHCDAWRDLRGWLALLPLGAVAEPLRPLPGYRGDVVADRPDF